MASIKMGAIVTDIKGKIGGTVFQGSVAGGVMKNNAAKKSTSGSSKLTKADAGRVFLPQRTISSLASGWRSLSLSDQLSWKTAAPSFPFLNKYGVSYTPSGYQLYMSVNANLTVINQTLLTVAPTPSELVNMPPFVIAQDSSTSITIDTDIDLPPGYLAQISATVGMSAGRQPAKGDYKLIAILTAIDVLPFELFSAYTAVFGSLPVGSTIWFSGKLTKADAGRSSQAYTANVVIV